MRPLSSVGQSCGFLIRRSWVRAPQGVPHRPQLHQEPGPFACLACRQPEQFCGRSSVQGSHEAQPRSRSCCRSRGNPRDAAKHVVRRGRTLSPDYRRHGHSPRGPRGPDSDRLSQRALGDDDTHQERPRRRLAASLKTAREVRGRSGHGKRGTQSKPEAGSAPALATHASRLRDGCRNQVRSGGVDPREANTLASIKEDGALSSRAQSSPTQVAECGYRSRSHNDIPGS